MDFTDPTCKVDWSTSSDEDDLLSETGSTTKLQFRKAVIKACWNGELGMSEVLQHKGRLLVSIGIVRNGNTYLSIEETLNSDFPGHYDSHEAVIPEKFYFPRGARFLAEIGALLLVDDDDVAIPLKDIYKKVAAGKGGCSWEHFEVYRYLKSLGYIVGRHDISWSLKSIKSCSTCVKETSEEEKTEPASLLGASIVQSLKDLQIGELHLGFDVYLPNSKFKKTSPGDPCFTVYLERGHPPSRHVAEKVRLCKGFPVKIAHVEHGRVSFFSFEEVELPVLP